MGTERSVERRGRERGIRAAPAVVFRFHSRDLHMVLGPKEDGGAVGFRVKLDGSEPNADCGADTAADGSGTVKEPRLYQLIRQKGEVDDRTFEIEFLEPVFRLSSSRLDRK